MSSLGCKKCGVNISLTLLFLRASCFALQDRKYFDSGDYALSKAGVGPQNAVGTTIPNPEKCVPMFFPRRSGLMSSRSIPHASPHGTYQLLSTSPANSASSPVRESVLAQSETTPPDDSEQPFPPAELVAPAPVTTSVQK